MSWPSEAAFLARSHRQKPAEASATSSSGRRSLNRPSTDESRELTARRRAVQDQLVKTAGRRTVACALVLVATMTASASVCAGWMPVAQDAPVCRAAECTHATGECCTSGEQRRPAETFAAGPTLTPAEPPLRAVFIVARLDRPDAFAPFRRPVGSPPQTYLLLSVFLI